MYLTSVFLPIEGKTKLGTIGYIPSRAVNVHKNPKAKGSALSKDKSPVVEGGGQYVAAFNYVAELKAASCDVVRTLPRPLALTN